MRYFKKNQAQYLLICAVMIFGCAEKKEIKEVPVTSSENLNTLLNVAPLTWINLNEIEIDTIIIPSDRIFEDRMFVSESLYVNSPQHITAFGDHLIVNEFGKGNVVALDKNGIPQRLVGREGRGPGEFEYPYGIMTAGEHLYIYDDAQKRISVFDKSYDLVKIFDFKEAAPGSFSNKIAMNEDVIAYENFYSSTLINDGSNKYSNLLWTRLTENPDSVYFRAIPRIIPLGKQPSAYNQLILSLNDVNELAVAFPGLPYLFMYQDSNHVSTIALEAVHYDTTEVTSLEPTEFTKNEGVRVTSLIMNLNILDNGDILFSSFGQLHHLKKESDDEYSHYKSYLLLRGDTGKQIGVIQNMAVFPEEPYRFYVVGWRNVFELNLGVSYSPDN